MFQFYILLEVSSKRVDKLLSQCILLRKPTIILYSHTNSLNIQKKMQFTAVSKRGKFHSHQQNGHEGEKTIIRSPVGREGQVFPFPI